MVLMKRKTTKTRNMRKKVRKTMTTTKNLTYEQLADRNSIDITDIVIYLFTPTQYFL